MVQRACRLVNTQRFGESGTLGVACKLYSLFLHFALCISCSQLFLNYLFIINQLPSKFNDSLSSVSCHSKLIKPKERESPIYILSEAQVTIWTKVIGLWNLGEEQSCRTELLTYGIQGYILIDHVRIELNCRKPRWYRRIAWWNPHMLELELYITTNFYSSCLYLVYLVNASFQIYLSNIYPISFSPSLETKTLLRFSWSLTWTTSFPALALPFH